MLASKLSKLQTGIHAVGFKAALAGLLRLSYLKLRRPRYAELRLRSGVTLRFEYPGQMPTVLVMFGDYIDPEYAFLEQVVSPGDRVVDIGAGIGQFALAMARRGATVECYEPVIENVNMLAWNAKTNGFGDSVHLRHVAVGKDTRGVNLVNSGYGSAASLRTHMDGLGETPSTTIDAELLLGPQIKVLKLNVAGGEPAVLQGAREFLRRRRAEYLVMLLSLELIEMLPLIAACGYRFFYPAPSGRMQFIEDDFVARAGSSRHLMAVAS